MMETLRLKTRPSVEDDIENWDDDDFLIEGDDFTIHSHSTAANAHPHRRDSHSSFRSDFESIHGEEERQVHLPGDDEKSTLDALAAAERAGIPLPKNVSPSALMGGTIKRLGGRKIRKIIQEDWVDDLEFPSDAGQLQIKKRDSSQFPEAIRQVSGSFQPHTQPPRRTSGSFSGRLEPVRKISGSFGRPEAMRKASNTFPSRALPPQKLTVKPMDVVQVRKVSRPSLTSTGLIDIERFRDKDDDNDFFGDGTETIKVKKRRNTIKPITFLTPATPLKVTPDEDDFEHDFELPMDGTLRLSNRRETPKLPTLNTSDDFEWGEGSLGTRFGGTRRDHAFSTSSVSAFSPSIASSTVAESEDEFDGIILPPGPLNWEERLHRRRQSRSSERIREEPVIVERVQKKDREEQEDFLSGLDIGDGEVFDSKKLTLHRNIKVKDTRGDSPNRPKASVALKFTNKPVAASRLPRPMGSMGSLVSHERTQTQSSLEPVSETGEADTRSSSRRSLTRSGHHSQASISNVMSSGASQPAPSTTTTRRNMAQKTTATSQKAEPTTTNAQLLRMKRSMPGLRPQSQTRSSTTRSYERPPSRTEATRAQSSVRPKTPVERVRNMESTVTTGRKGSVPSVAPFLPAGASASQSYNVNSTRNTRNLRRHDSEGGIDYRPTSRGTCSRASNKRSPSPRKHRSVDFLAAEGNRKQLNKPFRVRNFGDGHELDGFDDLPTSTQAEAKYLRQPVNTGPKAQARNRLYQNIAPNDRNNVTPSPPVMSRSPARFNDSNVPSFARDTAASRRARESCLAQRNVSGQLAPLTAQRVAQLSTNRVVKGMCYNPETFRWEGNDNVLRAFEAPVSSPSTASVKLQHAVRERESATPRPALITNIGTTKGVQVVKGMVFDPQNMCWLKLGPQNDKAAERGRSKNGSVSEAMDDEDDVFKDIPDLEDHTITSTDGGSGRTSDVKDDWLVGEEFDVGPEFVRRQREEEERWRKKCQAWATGRSQRGEAWKWAIRDIVKGTVEN
ncbi:hypothetical protein NCU01584 [Neurospora crassa OR74A]|uniref:Cytokinesis inhibitor byr4 n=1 Tax=Neurospora crassa (strain ATCC 24698 / 74-OR23-1A / CBS 708.71 / DSM 1257 / FGSC 987) TaxID=367110 RepID=V5IR46_NEUCR|nr:hypothetical protein NCU01584 [Neurospora crassa OR74A]ESA43661.1 hypothetical protein NCU01584 [Neurospora crassa OR74A]|eukprot:XP_011393465.1 hypothetical protein NCU01584 [Neurospora crassa OR74A]